MQQTKKMFKAFGKKFTREQAEWLIYSDKRSDICYAHNTDTLEYIIRRGWKGTEEWSDKELQDALDELLEENIVYKDSKKELPAFLQLYPSKQK